MVGFLLENIVLLEFDEVIPRQPQTKSGFIPITENC